MNETKYLSPNSRTQYSKTVTKSALTTGKSDREVSYLFKKYNFCVKLYTGRFKVFSYEANFENVGFENYVNIKVKDAVTNKVVKLFSVTVDSICKLAVENSYSIETVLYEDFCVFLFKVIVESISQDEDL